eukprot:CAMPEP_0194344922 /NCGR_PEP_ID=MMETSP0171-20130528/103566_1 /TAXON_ID=218684 /ORGANISM="Corethron pennatum, Strain L29A3" /LENGTH=135 /DNA_ID=CAMNT_0039111779 /DNA_START=1763 /DNA_END=2168 /DNA_ORIENTATION=-
MERPRPFILLDAPDPFCSAFLDTVSAALDVLVAALCVPPQPPRPNERCADGGFIRGSVPLKNPKPSFKLSDSRSLVPARVISVDLLESFPVDKNRPEETDLGRTRIPAGSGDVKGRSWAGFRRRNPRTEAELRSS